MSSHRALEVIFGVVTLVSVVSVPVPRRGDPPKLKPPARIDARRVEDLQRVSQTQSGEIARLVRDTRALANLVRTRDGGTVDGDAARALPSPENEEHECSQ